MDVVCAETKLMRAFSPADIFADVWVGVAVVRIDDGVAVVDVVAVSSSDRKPRFGVGIVRSVHTQVGSEQIGASDRQCVHTIGLTVSAQCEGIGWIECRWDIQIRYEEPPEYRMACTRLPIEPRDFHVFALVCLQSKV